MNSDLPTLPISPSTEGLQAGFAMQSDFGLRFLCFGIVRSKFIAFSRRRICLNAESASSNTRDIALELFFIVLHWYTLRIGRRTPLYVKVHSAGNIGGTLIK